MFNRNFKNHNFEKINIDLFKCSICKILMHYDEVAYITYNSKYRMFEVYNSINYFKNTLSCEEFQIKKLLE